MFILFLAVKESYYVSILLKMYIKTAKKKFTFNYSKITIHQLQCKSEQCGDLQTFPCSANWPFYVNQSPSECKKEISRSSHQRCSIIKAVPRNFARFTGKHHCQSFFFLNKVACFFQRTPPDDCFWVSLIRERNAVFFTFHNQKERASAVVTKFVFFRSFYNSCYDVLFLLIKKNLQLLSYILTKSIPSKFLQN